MINFLQYQNHFSKSLNEINDFLLLNYNSSDRYYHNLNHINSLLYYIRNTQLDNSIHFNVFTYEMIAWWHDSILDTTRNDNELKSAESFLYYMKDMLPTDIIDAIVDTILVTKHHVSNTPSIQLFCDFDCLILSSPWDEYINYINNVRNEYAWASDDAWKDGRRLFLYKMLNKDKLYYNYKESNNKAISNMISELNMLSY